MRRTAIRALKRAEYRLIEFTFYAAVGAFDNRPYLEVQSERAALTNAYRQAWRTHAIVVEGALL